MLISLLKNPCAERLRGYLFGFVFFGEPPRGTKGTAKAQAGLQCHSATRPGLGCILALLTFVCLLISLGTNLSPGSGRGSRPLELHKGFSFARGFPRTALKCHQCCFKAQREGLGAAAAKGLWGQCWTCPTCLGWGEQPGTAPGKQHTGMARSLKQHSAASQGAQSSSSACGGCWVLT